MKHKTIFSLSVLLLSSLSSLADAMQVTPTRIDLSTEKQKSFIKLTNDHEEPLLLKTEVMQWNKDGEKETLTSTKDILAVPLLTTIPAGHTQIIRLALKKAPDNNLERAYRLFLQEVPPPPKAHFKGVQVALRVSLPIYVAPVAEATHNRLVWSAKKSNHQSVLITCTNNNNVHQTIYKLTLTDPSHQTPIAPSINAFKTVFPQQTGEWNIPVPDHNTVPDSVALKIESETASMETTIPVQR